MKSAFNKLAAGLFFITDIAVSVALTFGCCFKKPEDVHPCEYAFALIFGTVFLAIAAFAAMAVCVVAIAAVWTYPIQSAGITGALAVALTIGYGRRASRNWSKTK